MIREGCIFSFSEPGIGSQQKFDETFWVVCVSFNVLSFVNRIVFPITLDTCFELTGVNLIHGMDSDFLTR